MHTILCRTVPTLGSFHNVDLNKLVVSDLAKQLGFAVPEFWVVHGREAVQHVLEREPRLITKAMSDGIFLFARRDEKTGYFSYTESVDADTATNLPTAFPPSLMQQRIEKACDVRVFFLAGRCYSMAILSQGNVRTRVDFRKYDVERPNRCVPYQLPTHVEARLIELFRQLDLNTGSVDLILDKSGTFYFLEVNPVGQFCMVSEACNTRLEREVALLLIDYAKQRRVVGPHPRTIGEHASGVSLHPHDARSVA